MAAVEPVDPVVRWARTFDFSPVQIDCTTAIMLKILDGKCRMSAEEKRVMTLVYDVIKTRPGDCLEAEVRSLIDAARRADRDAAILQTVYEKRVLAETMISRPVMKAYKALLREQGVIGI